MHLIFEIAQRVYYEYFLIKGVLTLEIMKWIMNPEIKSKLDTRIADKVKSSGIIKFGFHSEYSSEKCTIADFMNHVWLLIECLSFSYFMQKYYSHSSRCLLCSQLMLWKISLCHDASSDNCESLDHLLSQQPFVLSKKINIAQYLWLEMPIKWSLFRTQSSVERCIFYRFFSARSLLLLLAVHSVSFND